MRYLIVSLFLSLALLFGCSDDGDPTPSDAASEMGTVDSSADTSNSDTASDAGRSDVEGEAAVAGDGTGDAVSTDLSE